VNYFDLVDLLLLKSQSSTNLRLKVLEIAQFKMRSSSTGSRVLKIIRDIISSRKANRAAIFKSVVKSSLNYGKI